MIEQTKLLLRLYARPAQASGAILDQGGLLYASMAVLAVSLIDGAGPRGGFYLPLLILAAVYVPGLVLLGKAGAAITANPGAGFRRDYAPLLTCTGMAWAAANLPRAIAGWWLPAGVLAWVTGAALLYFLFLVFFAVRTVLGTDNRVAAAIVALSWIPLVAAGFLWGPLRMVLGWIASPFFLFYAWYYLGGELGNLGAGWRARQHFQRMMNAAALNPHDGEAQYQLGLIYESRRQLTQAIEHYRRAVAIDAGETDAHFQLGKIARRQGRLKDALESFQIVYDQDDKHSQSEILRELGAVYLAARQFEDARRFLEDYIDRRPYDPEGLYYLGEALEGLQQRAEARGAYERTVEAVETAPRYRRRVVAPWSRMAQKQLRLLRQA